MFTVLIKFGSYIFHLCHSCKLPEHQCFVTVYFLYGVDILIFPRLCFEKMKIYDTEYLPMRSRGWILFTKEDPELVTDPSRYCLINFYRIQSYNKFGLMLLHMDVMFHMIRFSYLLAYLVNNVPFLIKMCMVDILLSLYLIISCLNLLKLQKQMQTRYI
jgi:hypothetical protein